MSDLIAYHLEDGIATLTLSNGKVNAISPDVITAFNAALDQAEQDRAVVIITGQPGILSGGYDLKVMTASPEQAIELVRQGSTLARRMLAHPFPVVIACSGHAVAMHHAGIELARDRLRKSAFHRSVINGEMFNPLTAVDAGFLDKVVKPEELQAAALEVARQLKKINMKAHKNTKLKVRKALLETLDKAIEEDRLHPL